MKRDSELIQIVDRAMAEAARRSGSWLACRVGCYQCCIGPFAITPLDAGRLREGLEDLEQSEPERAARVRRRAQASVDRIRREYPQDPVRSVLEIDGAVEDELCPALDPESGACDLYASRPILCRTFGAAVSLGAEPVGVCELCYQGATDEQIAGCRVEVDLHLESELLGEMERSGTGGETLVAFALIEAS
jgi:Fe-S-cluster containining protein